MVKQQIGKLDRLVTVHEFANVKDPYNANERSAVEIKKVWAQMEVTGSAEDHAEKISSTNKRNYIIHYDSEIMAKEIQHLAIEDGKNIYNVIGFDDDFAGRKMFVRLKCEYDG